MKNFSTITVLAALAASSAVLAAPNPINSFVRVDVSAYDNDANAFNLAGSSVAIADPVSSLLLTTHCTFVLTGPLWHRTKKPPSLPLNPWTLVKLDAKTSANAMLSCSPVRAENFGCCPTYFCIQPTAASYWLTMAQKPGTVALVASILCHCGKSNMMALQPTETMGGSATISPLAQVPAARSQTTGSRIRLPILSVHVNAGQARYRTHQSHARSSCRLEKCPVASDVLVSQAVLPPLGNDLSSALARP